MNKFLSFVLNIFSICSLFVQIFFFYLNIFRYTFSKLHSQAGSRNEGHDNAGVSHALRVASGLATKKNTAFGIVRNLQQVTTKQTKSFFILKHYFSMPGWRVYELHPGPRAHAVRSAEHQGRGRRGRGVPHRLRVQLSLQGRIRFN